MSCEDVARDLDAYVDRELDADTATAVRDHVSGCAACRRQVSELEALGRLVRSTPYYSAPDRLRARVSARTARLTHARAPAVGGRGGTGRLRGWRHCTDATGGASRQRDRR